MRAVVMDSRGAVTVEERPDPQLPGARGAIVRVSTTGICGSDLHFFEGDLPCVDGLAVGHEAVGTIVELGDAVAGMAVGDRVAVSCITGCGQCAGCGAGDPAVCDKGSALFGFGSGLGGGQAELLAVPDAATTLLVVPDQVDDEAAVLLTDNIATAWTAARRGDVTPGATVLVLGLGAVGLCAVRAAYAQGAAQVFVYDPVSGRRSRAEDSGGIPVGDDVSAEVLAATGGKGVDSVIDAVATDKSLDSAFYSVRAGGTISVVGIHDLQPYPLPILTGVYRSITLRMSMAAVQSAWRELLPLVAAGRLDTSGIVTHHYSLEQAPDAYAKISQRTADCTKVVLRT
jgi:alcohol dehydrogenase